MNPTSMARVVGGFVFGAMAVSTPGLDTQIDSHRVAASGRPPYDQILPYILRYAEVEGDGESPVAVGAIYTPFLRQATTAHCGGADGLGPADDDKILVALRWYNEQAGFENVEPKAVAIHRGRLTLAHPIKPQWTKPGSDFDKILGCPAPWPDVALIAAFPGELFTPEVDFVIFKELEEGASLVRRAFKHGRIPRAAFPTWK